jgi:hypothetical protein
MSCWRFVVTTHPTGFEVLSALQNGDDYAARTFSCLGRVMPCLLIQLRKLAGGSAIALGNKKLGRAIGKQGFDLGAERIELALTGPFGRA